VKTQEYPILTYSYKEIKISELIKILRRVKTGLRKGLFVDYSTQIEDVNSNQVNATITVTLPLKGTL
jgi:hypothetical protein